MQMTAGLYLAAFLACGVLMTGWLLPRQRVLNRVWLGLSLGLLLMMWLPALWAFAFRFGLTAHWLALGTAGLMTAGAWLARDRRPKRGWDAEETRQLRQLGLVCLPLIVLSAWLQYTHNMRVDQWGAWNVGQSTYGDLPMHTAFITGLRNAQFPPDYPFYPGNQLSYPFLMDSLSTSLMMLGFALQASIIVPGTLMMALCFMGVMLLAREMTLGKKTIVLAALLFFLNGGLGFFYDFDQAGGFEGDGTLTVWARIQEILTGYYKTPTNQPDPNNLRWSNIIADLFVPQRTLLGGYCMAIPCFYLLYVCFDPAKRDEHYSPRALTLLGMWGGLLPLIHTHSFLALGLCSAGMLVFDMIHDRERVSLLRRYLIYAAIAVGLALPQLLGFTFRQTFQSMLTGEEGHSFLVFQFNWVNNPSGNGMRDLYGWFYVKNIGLPFVLLILALFEKDRHMRRIFAGAFAIILAAELIRFQPNEYDNNKLFYLAWMLCCMIVADYCAKLWRRLAGLRARPVIAALTAVLFFLSASLTLWRECVSDYQAFGSAAVEAARYAESETDQDSTFLCGTQHLNPISSIAGRKTVCGPDLWLYWHGFTTTERKLDISRFYTDPRDNIDVLQKYDVDYIFVSSYELSSYSVDLNALNALFERVYDNSFATIWKVPEG